MYLFRPLLTLDTGLHFVVLLSWVLFVFVFGSSLQDWATFDGYQTLFFTRLSLMYFWLSLMFRFIDLGLLSVWLSEY